MGDDADGHELFTVVATVHHEGVGETLDDWALGLSESLDSISASGVRDVDGCSDLDVITIDQNVSPKVRLVLQTSSRVCPSLGKESYVNEISLISTSS
jgi:hypothetical protein